MVLLALAEAEPLKAYELIAELGRLFSATYRPSPGAVYPALNALVAEALLEVDTDGRGKRYRLTTSGLAALDSRRRQLAALEDRTGARLREDGSLRPTLERFTERVMKVSGRVEPGEVEAVLDAAAREIEHLKGGRNGKRG